LISKLLLSIRGPPIYLKLTRKRPPGGANIIDDRRRYMETDPKPKFDEADFKLAIAASTIGLMKYVDRDGQPDALPAGTGTLVSVGEVFGLLTAAHVLSELPLSGPVGIVRFIRMKQENPHLMMSQTDRISFGRGQSDLAFLRLPEDVVGSLKAGNTFVDLLSRRTAFVEDQKSDPYFLCIAGIIAELTRPLPEGSQFRVGKGVTAALTSVEIDEGVEPEEGVVHVRPNIHDSDRPGSYGGTSGGGLWRCYVDRDLQRAKGVALAGVAFRQSGDRRTISCVGPVPIYGELIDRVLARWPQ
jgi:hypothetical protein